MTLPGSKSLTNRALVLAALADGPSTLYSALRAGDTGLMAAALRALGTHVAEVGEDWRVVPAPLRGPAAVDCGLAGTVLRFVPALAALGHGPVEFHGDARAGERPMAVALQALRDLGVDVTGPQPGRLPFRITGTGGVRGGRVVIDASASSQFVSGLLLAGARFDEGVEVLHRGAPVPSFAHIAMTVTQLRERGVVVDDSCRDHWVVRPGPIGAVDAVVEPDLSSGAPFVAAALVTGGRVRVVGWPAHTDQAGDRMRDVAGAMGARVERDDRDLVVTGADRIDGVDLDLHEVGELTPVVAALCALAATPSRLRGVAHLRGHESDRLAALTRELTGLGAWVTELPDGLRIVPRKLHGGLFSTHGDHRMAQAGAVLGLVVGGLRIAGPEASAKTFPAFVPSWERFVG